jgi:hypothetical protein
VVSGLSGNPDGKFCVSILRAQGFNSRPAKTHIIASPHSCYSTPFDDDIVFLTFHYILPWMLLCNTKLSAVKIFMHNYAASLNK